MLTLDLCPFLSQFCSLLVPFHKSVIPIETLRPVVKLPESFRSATPVTGPNILNIPKRSLGQ